MSKKINERSTNTNNSFKIIIILLTFIMLCSLFYIYKQGSKTKNTIVSLRHEKLELTNEKQAILNDLEKSKIYLEQALSNKSALSKELVEEQNKVNQLIAQLKNLQNSKIDSTQIAQFRQEAQNADAKIAALIKELNSYKKKVDSTNVVLKSERKAIDTLKTSNKKLATKVNEAAKLYFYDLKVTPLKVKSSGSKTETDKASRTDVIKVSFMIAENDFAKAMSKDFYIQIIDSKNNVIGSKKTENFGNQTLTFSGQSNVNYQNKTIKVEQEIPTTNLEKGYFFINVFDNSKLILKTSLDLK
jgi:hypothetical protein